jgi:sigma-B regulation protein RsbU (phosphoserine phosphatase)
MQRSRPTVGGLGYSARCRQMQAVGGDFYDFLPLGDDRLALAVGDASGKGLPGALMVSNVQSSVRTASFFAADNLPVTLDAVNRQVYESSLADRYATLFYCVLDSSARILRYVNAGHPPALLIRRDGSCVFLEAGGAPVGMFPAWNYEEGVIDVRAGDVIVAYTDGVIEATNPEGEEWGLDGLREAVDECDSRSPEDIVNAVFAALDEYTDRRQGDDATVVALKVR